MTMFYEYEKLVLVDLAAPRVLSQRNRAGNSILNENFSQDSEDAKMILGFAGLNVNLCPENIVDVKEKYMIETQPANRAVCSSETLNAGVREKGIRKPHYTRLLVVDNGLVFQAACCLPLKIIAASLDGHPVSGRILFNSYSGQKGGKLVYEFIGKGKELIIDLKRGESTRSQRLIFCGIGKTDKKIP